MGLEILKRNIFGFIEIFLALVLGSGLTILLFCFYYLSDDRFGDYSAITFTKDDLTLVAGEGEKSESGLVIEQAGRQGVAFVSSSAVNIPSGVHTELRWDIDGLQAHTDIRFVWATKVAPSTMREVPLKKDDDGLDRINLDFQRYWQGTVVGIGLMIYGKISEPVTVRQLQIRQPASVDVPTLLTMLWKQWSVFQGWSQRSINFNREPQARSLFPPLLAAVTWVGLTSLIYTILAFIRRRRLPVQAFLIFFVAAWLALDIRWQSNLARQLALTYQQFAGKNWEEKRLSDIDGELFRFMLEVKNKLPKRPVRLFLITADPQGATNYLHSRAHYHLLPHNVYSKLSLPPTSVKTQKGDYILIINPIRNIGYNVNEKTLEWGDRHTLPVEPVYSTRMGALFRVRDEI